jgi:hypothetical protein
MRAFPLAIIATMVLPALPASAQEPPPLTLEQALSMPTDRLADLAFRQMGARMMRVTRPTASGDVPRPVELSSLVFASAPHATGTVGVCSANRAEVEFEAPVAAPFSSNGPTTPARARLIRAAQVYKVIGEIEPYVEVSEQRAAEEDRRCAEAGPVIGSDYGDTGRAGFFAFEGAIEPTTALLVLQRAISEARAGRYRSVACTPQRSDPHTCRNPVSLLGDLDLGRLQGVSISRAGLQRGRYLVEASFLISENSSSLIYWAVGIEVALTGQDDIEGIGRLGRAEIHRQGVEF